MIVFFLFTDAVKVSLWHTWVHINHTFILQFAHLSLFQNICLYPNCLFPLCQKLHSVFVRWVEISLGCIVYEVPCENCGRLRSGPVSFSLGNFPYLKQNFDPSSPMHCCNTGKKNISSCQTLWKVIKINMSIDWNGHLKEIQKLWTLVLDLPIFKWWINNHLQETH